MKRIAIIGLSGSGKSTFANKLGKKLNRPVIHLDKEYWTCDWKRRYTSDEWNKFSEDLINQDEWIIDGNYRSTMASRLNRADIIIFFDFPKWRCLLRAFIRIFNKKPPFDKSEGTKERISWELIKYIIKFSKSELEEFVLNYKDKIIYRVKNNRDTEALLNKLGIF